MVKKQNSYQTCCELPVYSGKEIVTNTVTAYEFQSAFVDSDGVILQLLDKSNVAIEEKTYSVPEGAMKLLLTVTTHVQPLEDLVLYGLGLGENLILHVNELDSVISPIKENQDKINEEVSTKADTEIVVKQSENLFDYSQGYELGDGDGNRVDYDVTPNHYIPVNAGVKYYFQYFMIGSYRTANPQSIYAYDVNKSFIKKYSGSEVTTEEDGNKTLTVDFDGFIKIVVPIGQKDSLYNWAITLNSVINQNFLLPDYYREEETYLNDNIKLKRLDDNNLPELSTPLRNGAIRFFQPVYDNLHTAARFFSLRETYVDSKLQNAENIIWVDNNEGSDDNNGKTFATPIKTLSKLKELLSNNSIVRIKRGSIFRDDFTVFDDLDTVRFECYGDDTQELPIITSLSILTNWEKVGGYDTIYKCPVHAFAGSAERAMTQVYVDGNRIDDVYSHSDLTEEEAMSYLSENPDHSSWFSGGTYTQGWEEKECYYYISLSDNPSNHLIEANRYFSNMLLRYRNNNISFVGLKFRGSGHRDGLSLAVDSYRIFFDNCIICDHEHHGVVFNEAYFYDTIIQSEWVKGIQYHWFFSSNDYNFDIIISKCKCILGNNKGGSLIAGHGSGTNGRFAKVFVEDFYAEGGTHLCGTNIMAEGIYIDKVTLIGTRSITDGNVPNRKIHINRLKANIVLDDSIGGYYSILGEVSPMIYLTNSWVSVDCKKKTNSYLYSGLSGKEFGLIYFNNVFFYFKNYTNLVANRLINKEDTVNTENCKFINCIFAAEKPSFNVKYLSLISEANIDVTGSKFYGMKRNTSDEDTEFPLEDLKKYEFMRLMYVEGDYINSFLYE